MKILSAILSAVSVLVLVPVPVSHARATAVTVSRGDARTLHAQISLDGSASGGFLSVEELVSGPPAELVVEWVDTACGFDATPDLYLNDSRFALAPAEAEDRAGCGPRRRTSRVQDTAGLAAAWRADGENVVRLTSLSGRAAVSSALVRVGDGLASPVVRLFDSAGGPFDVGAPLPRGGGAVRRIEVSLEGAALPHRLDLSGLADGRHALCVSRAGATTCTEFDHAGEVELRLDASADPRQLPVAVIAAGGPSECSSAFGATVNLDGTASTGDIATYEWFENFGTRGERLLGTGAQLSVTLALGSHAVTLKVTDPAGQSAAAQTTRTVVDTVAPTLRMVMTPAMLWPADHRMVSVTAEPIAYDACGTPSLVLTALSSTEVDDAPGEVDGNTVGDIQGAALGTADRTFDLRAETGAYFGGRRYLVTYALVDASGNRAVWRGGVTVRAPRRQQYAIRGDKPDLEILTPPPS
jgi:hypothetical protein